ncbi:MAG TPA: histidine kinase [Usitatibacteraceae bacterium]|nr:histidine kinase [Usitatibacteraceae bacterium]
MKPFSDSIHRTPWWALVIGGFAIIVALAVFVTPFHLIEYRKEGATPEENRAIKREIDNTFAEGAVDVARSAILALRGATSDPLRRAELDRAIEELDGARAELRDAGREVLRAKREAIDTAREATREAASAIEEARRNAEQALKAAGLENDKVKAALEQSLKSAREAEDEAKKALETDAKGAETRKRIVIGMGAGKDRPLLDIDVSKADPGERPHVEIHAPGATVKGPRGSITLDLGNMPEGMTPTPPTPPTVALPPLPPEIRAEIRRNVGDDLRKIGIGAGLVLLFIPLFILTVVAKFFIDRSRAAQRMADLKRKEAEYHRMSQQVTEAKLQALQAQVEPHFLYNTLANVQALTEVDPAQANTMVGHLIQYLRSALPKMRESVSSVGQEIELVRAYLNILQMRMGKRLSFEIAVPESLLATPFPPLMVPSLVENAIKHGLEPLREGGSVLITAQAQDGQLRLVVSDTGRGFGETVGTGVGLANIRERLAGLYGDKARLTLESNSPSGVIATIEVPLNGLRAATAVPPGAAATNSFAWPGNDPGSRGEAQPAAAKSAAGKVLSAVGTAERTWRKTLSFAFVALVVVAAVVSGLGVFGVLTGLVPVQVGTETLTGTSGALLGAAGIAIGFAAVVLVLAIVAALIYGLGWLLAGLAIFIPVVILIALSPALAPVVLVVLLIWWILRKKKDPQPVAAPKVEPVMKAQATQAADPGKEPPAV